MKLIFGVLVSLPMLVWLVGLPLRLMMLRLLIVKLRCAITRFLITLLCQQSQNISFLRCYKKIQNIA